MVTRLAPLVGAFALWAAAAGAVPAGGPPTRTPAAMAGQERRWQREDGLPASEIRALAQSSDGRLWLAGEQGVSKFAGTGFEVVELPVPLDEAASVTALGADGTRLLAVTRESVIVIGPGGTLVHPIPNGLASTARRLAVGGRTYLASGSELFEVGRPGLRRLPVEVRGVIGSLWSHADGSLWFADDAGIHRVSPEGRSELRIEPADLPGPVTALAVDRRGRVWAGGPRGLLVVDGGARERFDTSRGLSSDAVTALLEDDLGRMWVGTRRGLNRVTDGRVERPEPSRALATDPVSSLLEDRERSTWVATLTGGLYQLRDSPVEFVAAEPASPPTHVTDVVAVPGGVLVASPEGGLGILRGGRVERVSADGLEDGIAGLAAAPDRGVWIATRGGLHLAELAADRLRPVRAAVPLPGDVAVVSSDGAGGVWLASRSAGLLHVGSDARLRPDAPVGFSGAESAVAMTPAAGGRTWVATKRRLCQVGGSSPVDCFPLPKGVEILSLVSGQTIGTWAGTARHGLARVTPGRLELFQPAMVAHRAFLHLGSDASGRLWAATAGGIFTATFAELAAALDEHPSAGTAVGRLLGVGDGLRSTRWPGAGAHGIATAPDGRVVFAAYGGLACIAPGARLDPDPPAPPVLERVTVGGAARNPHVFGDFAADTDPVEFTVATITFRPHVQTAFRYRLVGSDDAWAEAGPARSVAFVGLPPGDYRFEIAASGRQAAGPVVSYSFRVRPNYYETTAFRAGVPAALLLVVVLGVEIRIRSSRRREAELRRRVHEATMELEQANARLEDQATRDDLTGIHNRRYFFEQLDLELRRAARTREPVSLVVADVDVFKALNDTYGHPEGDSSLTRVAACMRAAARRPSDCVARIGGEEFAILLPGTAGAGAAVFAERVRRDVEALRIPNVNSPVRPSLTISLGVATAAQPQADGAAALVAATDRALYRAKAEGRNRVVVGE